MAVRKKSKTNVKQSLPVKHTCVYCGKHTTSESRMKLDFYITQNKFCKNGRIFLCKECVVKLSTTEENALIISKFKDVLKFIDRPFLSNIFETSIQEAKKNNSIPNDIDNEEILSKHGDSVVGIYMKNISMPQTLSLTWEHSTASEIEKITIDANDKWGLSYNEHQVEFLERFSKQMHDSHRIETPQHVQSVIMLSKMQLKLQEFLDNDDYVNFAKIHKEYQALLQSSGLRPIDAKDVGESMGIRSFSQIFEEIEKDGFIKPKPVTFMQDAVDRMIMYILNYSRKVFGKGILADAPYDRPLVDGEPTRMEIEEIEEYIITQEELESNGKL